MQPECNGIWLRCTDAAMLDSDIDLAIRSGRNLSNGGFDYFGQMEDLRQRLLALGANQTCALKRRHLTTLWAG
jgi:hypothetical protein